MQSIINGSEDSSRTYLNVEEQWHIPRHGNGRPLCHAALGGRIRTTKGRPRCHTCQSLDLPRHLDAEAQTILLGAHGSAAFMVGGRDAPGVGTLEDHDYVWFKRGGVCVITPRGRIIAQELLAPAPWLDPKTRLLHERRAFQGTRCGVGLDVYGTHDLLALTEGAKHKGRKTPTCIACLGAKW